MRVLHIISSPRNARSVSEALASRFLALLSERRANLSVDTLDVWQTDLPEFDGAAMEAKYADLAGVAMSASQEVVWQQIHALGARFQDADVILFGVPMWNFGIPYRLKHLIDAVSQRGILFDFDENGMKGLLGGRRMVVCAARGVALGPDFPPEIYDQQVRYLQLWARMVGIAEVHVAQAEATLGDPAEGGRRRNDALDEATRIAHAIYGAEQKYFGKRSNTDHQIAG